MGVQAGFHGGSSRFRAGRQAWLWPLSHPGSAVALEGRQRFCTSEGIRPVRLLQIDFGAVAHRAMWGYGVDPPADMNPHLDLASCGSARRGRDCCSRRVALGSGASAPLDPPVQRGDGAGLHGPVRRQDCAGNGSFLTARRRRYHSARYVKGPPHVHPRSIRDQRKLARPGRLEGYPWPVVAPGSPPADQAGTGLLPSAVSQSDTR
jgi:hypothetical protein